MHWQPDIFPIAPKMVCQTYSHCWGAWRAPLAQALLRYHKVGEADHEPDLPPVARAAPGQTPRAAPQGCSGVQGFGKGGLEGRGKVADAIF